LLTTTLKHPHACEIGQRIRNSKLRILTYHRIFLRVFLRMTYLPEWKNLINT
jgi:hypothetical protein